MIRALVTGATGFTGRYVTPLLSARGFDVHGLSSWDGDIRDAAWLRDIVAAIRPHYVVHLAGTPNLPDSQAEVAYSINVQGALNLLEACGRLEERPRKIILASSCYVYGDTGAQPADEDAPLEASGAYGKSKREMERMVAMWQGRLSTMIVRPFNYTGIGHSDQFLVPKLVRLFQQRGTDASFVEPNVIRDYSDVRWVAKVYVDLLDRPECGISVNVCSGIGVPLPTLVGVLEELTGHRVAAKPKPVDGMPKAALVGVPTRLLSMVGTPSPFSLAQTLQWMLGGPAEAKNSSGNSERH